ncbi:hypothetical protein [Anaerococcus sp.]|uniref:hypothetical protein n=1 Tax=Anaerococcus sp. TaxID=1872515 RepID=UPI002900D9F7|nr:hypothetical protein [Anaerococcus sp.]MDU1828238.1 hypothetical protein [Anaerococcus sp.]MDU1864500.1 hypothetical protein [Anaerococcus sp.]
MKNQVKTLVLALALLTATGCGSEKAVESKGVEIGKAQIETEVNEANEVKESKVSNVEKPKAEDIEIKEEDNRNYLIPQTRELKKEKEKEQSKEKNIEGKEEEKESQDKEFEEVVVNNKELKEQTPEIDEVLEGDKEEIAEEVKEEDKELAEEISDDVKEVAEENEEGLEYIEDDFEAEELLASNDEYEQEHEDEYEQEHEIEDQEYEVGMVSGTSPSTSLPKTVEEAVSSVDVKEKKARKSDNVTSGLTVASPSEAEVKLYWKNYQSQASNKADFYGLSLINPESEDIYSANPSLDLNNLNIGTLSNAAQLDALHIANTARYASGIKELTIGKDQVKYAQAATMINRLNLQIDHFPALPNGMESNSTIYADGVNGAKNSNLSSQLNLLDSVVEYLKDDLGRDNQLEVGHRRWILNPQSSSVGFGQTDEFNAMFVNNNNYDGENANTVYAYPGQTAISEFHSPESSLSLMFGENFDLTNATVEVKDLATGQVSTDLNVDHSFRGNSRAVTFGYGMNYEPGTKLQVKVNGVTKNGVNYPVEYTINYISIR